MSDIMRPIPFAQLMDWILTENAEKGSIFGIRKIVRHEGGAEMGVWAVKSGGSLFTTLHHSSLIARFSYHLFQGLVFIDDGTIASLIFFPLK